MYRKLLAFFVTLALLLSGCGDGSGIPKDTSEKMYELGIAALEAVDEYLDNKLDIENAKERLDNTKFWVDVQLEDDMEELDVDVLFGTKYANDSKISHNIVMISNALSKKSYGTGTTSKIVEHRNSLAEVLNKKSR